MQTLVLCVLYLIIAQCYNTDKEISSVYTLDEYNSFFNVFFYTWIVIE